MQGSSKQSQQTLKLPAPEANTTLQAAGAATLKLPPGGAATLKPSAIAGLKQHKAITIGEIETIWDVPKPMTEHSKKMATIVAGVDRMSSAFKDATKAKAEKRRMMDDMHETSMERVAQTRAEMEKMLSELAVYLQSFYTEYDEKLRTTLEELRLEEEERIAGIHARFQVLEKRQKALAEAIAEETRTRLHNTEMILGPARRSVELLVVDLDKEQRIRHTRNEELKQRMEDAVRVLRDHIIVENKNRIEKHEQVRKECELDVARIKTRQEQIEQVNIEKVEELRVAVENEEKLRKEGQDQVVEKITSFIQRFQAHIKEEGEMGC